MKKSDVKQLEKILNDFESNQKNAISQCKDIIKPYCSDDLYHCQYSRISIKVGELSLADVKTIVQDYNNELSRRDNDVSSAGIRQQMTRINKYGPENEYGK